MPSKNKSGAHDDDVFPMALADRRHATLGLVLSVTFRFEAVLDTEKLRKALGVLVETGGWRKLGARARSWEWHVPRVFTADRPGFIFTTTTHGGRLVDNPTYSPLVLDASTELASTFPIDRHLSKNLMFPPDTPNSLKDWQKRDVPQLFVHTILFDDATLLSVRGPHASIDAMALAETMKAWTIVLAGNPPPPVLPLKSPNPTEALQAKTPAQKSVLYDLRTNIFTMTCLALDIFVLSKFRPLECRELSIPHSALKKLHNEALQELSQAPYQKISYVTETDVVCAWLLHHGILAQKLSPSATIAFVYPMDIRGLLDDIIPPGTASLGNIFDVANLHSTAKQLAHDSIATTAARLRHCLLTQRTRQEMEARDSAVRSLARKTGIETRSFGYWNQHSTCISNWAKAGFYDFDFGPATCRAKGDNEPQSCKPASVHIDSKVLESTPLPLMGYLRGKDGKGNWWFYWGLETGAWGYMERELAGLSRLR